ncbi:hypothetical protein KUCAC02_013818, partial [Chaenocephalus aceratus]
NLALAPVFRRYQSREKTLARRGDASVLVLKSRTTQVYVVPELAEMPPRGHPSSLPSDKLQLTSLPVHPEGSFLYIHSGRGDGITAGCSSPYLERICTVICVGGLVLPRRRTHSNMENTGNTEKHISHIVEGLRGPSSRCE